MGCGGDADAFTWTFKDTKFYEVLLCVLCVCVAWMLLLKLRLKMFREPEFS